MFSAYDNQTNRYLESGKNSKNKQECIECVWDFWTGNPDCSEEDLKELSKDKESWLIGIGFDFTEHEEPIEEEED